MTDPGSSASRSLVLLSWAVLVLAGLFLHVPLEGWVEASLSRGTLPGPRVEIRDLRGIREMVRLFGGRPFRLTAESAEPAAGGGGVLGLGGSFGGLRWRRLRLANPEGWLLEAEGGRRIGGGVRLHGKVRLSRNGRPLLLAADLVVHLGSNRLSCEGLAILGPKDFESGGGGTAVPDFSGSLEDCERRVLGR